MNEVATKLSAENLDRAVEAFDRIEAATTLVEIETAWSDFLVFANRVFSKLEQGAKSNGKSKAWFDSKKHERRTNTLLRYVHHARNADEHGIRRVTEKEPGGIVLGVGPGAWRFDGAIGPGGRMIVTALGGQELGKSKFVDVIPARVRLVRVIDRGGILRSAYGGGKTSHRIFQNYARRGQRTARVTCQ